MKRLVLHKDWLTIGRRDGSMPSNPGTIQSELNNLYHFEDKNGIFFFASKDYPHIALADWINPNSTSGSIPKGCVRKIVTTEAVNINGHPYEL